MTVSLQSFTESYVVLVDSRGAKTGLTTGLNQFWKQVMLKFCWTIIYTFTGWLRPKGLITWYWIGWTLKHKLLMLLSWWFKNEDVRIGENKEEPGSGIWVNPSLEDICKMLPPYCLELKVVVQPAASADLSGVVFSLSNPNVSSYVTGQKCTLQFLQIINCSFFKWVVHPVTSDAFAELSFTFEILKTIGQIFILSKYCDL